MTHAELVARAVIWLRNTMNCSVVLSEMRCSVPETPDAIGWKYGHSHLVECKVSRSDFRADQNKKHRLPGMGHKRFYMTPSNLLKPEQILGIDWGWLEFDGKRVYVRKQAEWRKQWDSHGETSLLASSLRRVAVRVGEATLTQWLKINNQYVKDPATL